MVDGEIEQPTEPPVTYVIDVVHVAPDPTQMLFSVADAGVKEHVALKATVPVAPPLMATLDAPVARPFASTVTCVLCEASPYVPAVTPVFGRVPDA